jgi:hypothetical protein
MYVELLHTMLDDMQKAPACYQPTNYWKDLVPLITKDLEVYGFENFRMTESAKNIWVGVGNMDYNLKEYLLWLTHDNDEKAPHVRTFNEDLIGKPLVPFQFDGKNYTSTSLNYLLGIAYLKKYVDTTPIKNVIEIGAGFGMLGSIFLKAEPRDYFYVDVDLPPLAAVIIIIKSPGRTLFFKCEKRTIL